MADQLKIFGQMFWHALRNLLPIILVVAVFQGLVIGSLPEDLGSTLLGLLMVAVGVALFLQGLELGIFPIGKSLSNAFARQGSLPVLLAFGFYLGFAAVIAEPALIAVAGQAQEISEGRIHALTLRILVAFSVGGVVALGCAAHRAWALAAWLFAGRLSAGHQCDVLCPARDRRTGL